MNTAPAFILFNGKITTMDPDHPEVEAVAISNGCLVAVGSDREIMQMKDDATQVVDLRGSRVIPGLIDNHTHMLRAGLFYNLELRWDGVRSLAQAMQMLREQVARTPPPQWVRVVGGFTMYQFAEKRLPTPEELNQIAPETPVFIMHMHYSGLMNKAALRAVGYTRDMPNPPGAEIIKDERGEPTGLIVARPLPLILYEILNQAPLLPFEHQLNSTRHFMRELNRLGLTSVCDPGGISQSYPVDYKVIEQLNRDELQTVRIAFSLYTQHPGHELEDISTWIDTLKFRPEEEMFRFNGAGENLVFSARDHDNFSQPPLPVPPTLEADMEAVVRKLVTNRWRWRLHCGHNETITPTLNAFERVNREMPLQGIPWYLDHCETIDERNIERVAALGGNIAIQNRTAFQAEYVREYYGARAAAGIPPIKRMLQAGLHVGAGTDATRTSSFSPWLCLSWLLTGRGTGGIVQFPPSERFTRQEALWMWTGANAYFSDEVGKKGQIKVGQFADLAALSADYFTVPEEEIRELTSVLTVVAGKIVWADGSFQSLCPPAAPVMPDWSPVAYYGGYQNIHH